MKKFLKFLAFIMCVVLLVSLTACSPFMSASQIKKVVKEFGTPQAKMTLTFTSNGQKVKYVIIYDLMLEKTPITTINFINLVEKGFYQDVIFDSYNKDNNYFSAAKYSYRKDSESGSAHGDENISGLTIPGEFKTNNYSEPNGGYEQFSMFSLAMYHENKAESFDLANGVLIFSTASSKAEMIKPLNYENYAVFAKMKSIAIYEGDVETPQHEYSGDQMSSVYLERLTKQTSTSSCTMTTANGNSSSVTVLGSGGVPRFVFSIEMLGDKDWTKLPNVN